MVSKNLGVLATKGGAKSISKDLAPYRTYGIREIFAGLRVLVRGRLSGFYGSYQTGFLGGPEVRKFESDWEKKFNVRHAISVNSWTSGLEICLQSLDLKEGDEVLVPSWTMSASVAAIHHSRLTPVFVDIDPETFIPAEQDLLEAATSKTRAILIVDIFGLSANWEKLLELARLKGWHTICDAAQAIGVQSEKGWVGTFASIGGFSLNYHKHIHTGEGGVVVTNDDDLALRARLLRNHAEAVVAGMEGATGIQSQSRNLIGHNFRFGEIEAAVGRVQLRKMESLVQQRREIAITLRDALQSLDGLTLPSPNYDGVHAFYVLAMELDPVLLGVSREVIVNALRAEGVPVMDHYVTCHRLPAFEKFRRANLSKTETLQDQTFLGLEICSYRWNQREVKATISAFRKVWQNLEALRLP